MLAGHQRMPPKLQQPLEATGIQCLGRQTPLVAGLLRDQQHVRTATRLEHFRGFATSGQSSDSQAEVTLPLKANRSRLEGGVKRCP